MPCPNNFSKVLSSSQYPNGLKYAEVTSVLKKDDKSDKSNSSYSQKSIQQNYAKPDLPLPRQNFFRVSEWLSEKVQCATLLHCDD